MCTQVPVTRLFAPRFITFLSFTTYWHAIHLEGYCTLYKSANKQTKHPHTTTSTNKHYERYNVETDFDCSQFFLQLSCHFLLTPVHRLENNLQGSATHFAHLFFHAFDQHPCNPTWGTLSSARKRRKKFSRWLIALLHYFNCQFTGNSSACQTYDNEENVQLQLYFN